MGPSCGGGRLDPCQGALQWDWVFFRGGLMPGLILGVCQKQNSTGGTCLVGRSFLRKPDEKIPDSAKHSTRSLRDRSGIWNDRRHVPLFFLNLKTRGSVEQSGRDSNTVEYSCQIGAKPPRNIASGREFEGHMILAFEKRWGIKADHQKPR